MNIKNKEVDSMKGTELDGAFATQALDTSGEILDIEGCDISDLENGLAVLNFEHSNDQASDILGKITFAKKIFSEADCANDRELSFWKQIQLPFIYGKAELFDTAGHPGAVAAAAIIRYYHRKKEPLLVRYSIEGATIERKGNHLVRSVARRVAATIKPCNRSCYSGLLYDPQDAVQKSEKTVTAGQFYETSFEIRDGALDDTQDLEKALELGSYNAAPGGLTQGAALQQEDIEYCKKNKGGILAAIRDWNKSEPFKTFLKNRLPDMSDKYLDHFQSLVDSFEIKKTEALFNQFYQLETMAKAEGLFVALQQEKEELAKAEHPEQLMTRLHRNYMNTVQSVHTYQKRYENLKPEHKDQAGPAWKNLFRAKKEHMDAKHLFETHAAKHHPNEHIDDVHAKYMHSFLESQDK